MTGHREDIPQVLDSSSTRLRICCWSTQAEGSIRTKQDYQVNLNDKEKRMGTGGWSETLSKTMC